MPDPEILSPLRVQSTPVLVADRLRAGILDGTFPPLQQLSEVALSKQLGVSRGPIREAMQRLIQEGLLRGERNRGVFVVDLGPEDAQDIYLARGAVERVAAGILAGTGSDDTFRELQQRVDAIGEAAGGPWVELAARDLEFHQTLVSGAGSPRLDRMFRTLVAETRLCLSRLEEFYPGRDEVVREHQQILDALQQRDAVEADRLVQEHMEVSARRLAEGASRGVETGA